MRILRGISFFSVTILILSCSVSNSILELKRSHVEPTLTKEAFERVEPVLTSLKPGQNIWSTGLSWKTHQIKQRSKVIDICAASDGWAGAISGKAVGAVCRLGEPFSLKEGKIYGQHIYGYIVSPGIFVPRYSVQTVAVVIPEAEWSEDLMSKSMREVCFAYRPGEENRKVLFQQVRIHRVTEIGVSKSDLSNVKPSRPVSSSEAETLFSKERFENIYEKLMELPMGADLFSVIETLDGLIAAHYGGVDFTVFIDGLLKYKGEYFFAKTTSNGVYYIWPFGYVEGGKEIAKVALIFKNGMLHTIVPYSSKKEIAATLD